MLPSPPVLDKLLLEPCEKLEVLQGIYIHVLVKYVATLTPLRLRLLLSISFRPLAIDLNLLEHFFCLVVPALVVERLVGVIEPAPDIGKHEITALLPLPYRLSPVAQP